MITIDRPKGFRKVFQTAKGPKELSYPMDYGYFSHWINPQDGEGADVFRGSGGPRYGRFMKGKPGPDGGWAEDEHKWYWGLTDQELQDLRDWWGQHDPGLTWDWREFDQPGLEADLRALAVPKPPEPPALLGVGPR